jgi:hypothetical protein
MSEPLPGDVVDILRRIANGRRPTASGHTSKLTHHELTELARGICIQRGVDYSDKIVHGVNVGKPRVERDPQGVLFFDAMGEGT